MRPFRILPLLAVVGLLAACHDQTPVAPDNEVTAPLFNQSGEHAARVIHKGETEVCWMIDGNGEFVGPFSPINIITNGKNGNAHHICHAEGIANPTGKAIVDKAKDYPGEECWIWDGDGNWLVTTDWKQIISASGHATLTCHYKNK